MRKPLLIAAALFTLTSAQAAQARDWGIGVIFGEPTGFTAKKWQGPRYAYDLGVAYSLGDFVLMYGDYLWHFPGALGSHERPVSQITPYIGVGAAVFISSRTGRVDGKFYTNHGSVGLGLRVPLGVEWTPSEAPIGVMLEIVPGIGVVPSAFGFVQGGIGIRYYF